MNNKYFFISKPRCASTHIYEGLTHWNDKINGNKPYYHCTAIQMKNNFGHKYINAFSFGIVRHPYDLVVSWYNEHKKERYEEHIKNFYNLSFDEWIDKKCPTHWKHLSFNPLIQYKWLFDENNQLIVSYIMKLENYNDEINYIYNKIKDFLPNNITIENIKHTRKNETLNIKTLNKNQKEKIFQLFKEDFILFSYNK